MVTDGVEVIEKGSGTHVVLIHGDVFGADLTWHTQEPLASELRLRMVNRRGFGNSPDTDGEDFEVDAKDVAALLDGGAHLVGHSYGGVVALLAAARRPNDVKSLVVFEPPAFGLTAHDPQTAAFIADVKAIIASEPTAEEFLPRFIKAVGGDPNRLPNPLPPPPRHRSRSSSFPAGTAHCSTAYATSSRRACLHSAPCCPVLDTASRFSVRP